MVQGENAVLWDIRRRGGRAYVPGSSEGVRGFLVVVYGGGHILDLRQVSGGLGRDTESLFSSLTRMFLTRLEIWRC